MLDALDAPSEDLEDDEAEIIPTREV